MFFKNEDKKEFDKKKQIGSAFADTAKNTTLKTIELIPKIKNDIKDELESEYYKIYNQLIEIDKNIDKCRDLEYLFECKISLDLTYAGFLSVGFGIKLLSSAKNIDLESFMNKLRHKIAQKEKNY